MPSIALLYALVALVRILPTSRSAAADELCWKVGCPTRREKGGVSVWRELPWNTPNLGNPGKLSRLSSNFGGIPSRREPDCLRSGCWGCQPSDGRKARLIHQQQPVPDNGTWIRYDMEQSDLASLPEPWSFIHESTRTRHQRRLACSHREGKGVGQVAVEKRRLVRVQPVTPGIAGADVYYRGQYPAWI
ncbi:hypothetical protein B0T22DRAFT_308866 [Podospora appendiculata]|uniref:Secreted protein n=1 Tax=Podospora appendiculata TaxID=314037 RepID=A0AAE0WZL3_9PEZI|nr:hypothetical protein B0T22DRAFT_308866 [Podospora appendiculata]